MKTSTIDGGSQSNGNSELDDSGISGTPGADNLVNYLSNSKKKKIELKQQKEKMIQEEL